jgi:hypothetical protein
MVPAALAPFPFAPERRLAGMAVPILSATLWQREVLRQRDR